MVGQIPFRLLNALHGAKFMSLELPKSESIWCHFSFSSANMSSLTFINIINGLLAKDCFGSLSSRDKMGY
jgi:hypothetical protein